MYIFFFIVHRVLTNRTHIKIKIKKIISYYDGNPKTNEQKCSLSAISITDGYSYYYNVQYNKYIYIYVYFGKIFVNKKNPLFKIIHI